MLSRAQTLREIVTGLPRAIPLFEELHLDYCCRGTRSLAEACDAAGLDPDVVLERLADIERDAPPDSAAEPQLATLRALIEHIVERHHRFAREQIALLRPLMAKVMQVHRAEHPELDEVGRTFAHIVAELEPHQLREEAVLFPAILALEEGAPVLLPLPVDHPIARMSLDHDAMGRLLERLSALTAGYEPPRDACPTWRALYTGLAALERDLHLHIHLENNVLFPRTLTLAGR